MPGLGKTLCDTFWLWEAKHRVSRGKGYKRTVRHTRLGTWRRSRQVASGKTSRGSSQGAQEQVQEGPGTSTPTGKGT